MPLGRALGMEGITAGDAGGGDAPISGNSLRDLAVQFWMGKGAPQHVAEGIADRINTESGFKPGVMGDAGTSGGQYQHHADRLAALKQYAAAQGKPWTDPMVQHQRAFAEVTGADPIAAAHWQQILAAPDRKTANELWTRYFERPAGIGTAAGTRLARVGSMPLAVGAGGLGGGVGALPASDDTDAAAVDESGKRLARALAVAQATQPVQQAKPQQQQTAAAAQPAARRLALSPIPVPQAPNLSQGYQDALASILSGKSRRGLYDIFG